MSIKWVRAKDGAIFGVCKGLARTLDVPVGVFRLLWLCSILFFGAGVGIYLVFAITLPREDRTAEAQGPWILGVCAKISRQADLEVGLVRFLAVCLGLLSGGAVLVGYLVLYFVLDDKPRSSAKSPTTPPSIT